MIEKLDYIASKLPNQDGYPFNKRSNQSNGLYFLIGLDMDYVIITGYPSIENTGRE